MIRFVYFKDEPRYSVVNCQGDKRGKEETCHICSRPRDDG